MYLAQRIRSSQDGEYSPSPPPHLLDKLTDELLVVASDAVAKVATGLSGRQQIRLLAWTVADARGAQFALDKNLAETVGKRLERQANRVRAALAKAASEASEARAHARSNAADDAALTTELEAIDDVEDGVREFHRNEVYVGFTELSTLLEPPPSETPTVEVSAAGEPVGGVHISTQTEQMDLSTLSALDPDLQCEFLLRLAPLISDEREERRSFTALLGSALNHIVELNARLADERETNESLRAKMVSERCRADIADSRVAEAEERVAEADRHAESEGRKCEELKRQLSERDSELEDARAAADMEHIGEKNELKAQIRGLRYELALLKGTG
jgi:hypothetical protein